MDDGRLSDAPAVTFGPEPQRPMPRERYLQACDFAANNTYALLNELHRRIGGDDAGPLIQGALDALINFCVAGNTTANGDVVRAMLVEMIDHLLPQALAEREIGDTKGAA